MIYGIGRGLRRKENGGVCPEELEMGIEVEMEHTDDREEAERIAREHLQETPDYYTKLKGAGLGKASRLGIRLLKARKSRFHLTPEKRTVVRNGRAFEITVYVNRDKDKKTGGPGQLDLFSEPVEVSARAKAVSLMGNGTVSTLEKDGLMIAWKNGVPEGYTDEYMKAVGKISGGKAKKLYEAGMCVIGKVPKKAKEPQKNPKKISKAINSATPETRNAVTEELFGPPESREAAKTPYVYTPEETTLNPAVGGEVSALDYTKVVAKEVKAFKEKDVLAMERPGYIPEIEDNHFRYAGQRIEAVKLDDDRYVIITGRKEKERAFAVVSRAVLAATQDYYMKRSKAKYKEDVARATGRIKERAQKWVDTHNFDDDSPYAKREREYHEGILSGRIKITKRQHGIESPRVMGKNKMTYSNLDLIKLFRPDEPRWNVMSETLEDMSLRINDLIIQMEDDMNSHHKGEMTSYGNKGLKSDLYESHGVMVKRQNGDDITDVEVDQVRKAMDDMYGVYGDRSEMAKNYGLKISHSGEVLMHARKYVGIFFPAFKAIGVSAKYGSRQFGFTLSHEFAHFMDNYLGEKKGYSYSCDDPKSVSGKIASTFRQYMARAQKSEYQNRTCECFARAFEQYFAENKGEGEEYQRTTNTQGNHPTREAFNEKIRPLIDHFFQENDELLKSMMLPVYKIMG